MRATIDMGGHDQPGADDNGLAGSGADDACKEKQRSKRPALAIVVEIGSRTSPAGLDACGHGGLLHGEGHFGDLKGTGWGIGIATWASHLCGSLQERKALHIG